MTNHPLTDYLRKLRKRHNIGISALAEERGVSRSTIYKAESKSLVEWPTIEKSYGPLCRDEKELAHLLALWALCHVTWETTPTELSKDIAKIRDDEFRYMAGNPALPAVLESMEALSPPDRDLFISFARLFASSVHARTMAKAWVEALKPSEQEHPKKPLYKG